MTVYRTENKIVRFTLLKSDGTNLNIAGTQQIALRLYANGVFAKAYVLGTDPAFRLGNAVNEAELEITQAVMESLSPGTIEAKLKITVVDTEHTIDGVQIDESLHSLFILK